MKLKSVFRYDPDAGVFRICRLVGIRGRMMHGGYSWKLSLGLTPRLFHWSRGHWLASYGGIMT